MKFLKKTVTWGGYFKYELLCGALLFAIVAYICGAHKLVWVKLKNLVKKLKN